MNRGIALQGLGQDEEAVASYDCAIAAGARDAHTYAQRGLALQQCGRLDAAVASYDQAIALDADCAEVYYNRGNALKALRRLDAAGSSYARAIACKPDFAAAYANRGNVLRELEQPDGALRDYAMAIRLRPDLPEVHYNRGIVLQEQNQLDAAIAHFDQAIALDPDFAAAYWDKSLALLLDGDLARGWELYEWRWRNKETGLTPRPIAQPLWDGRSSVHGKTILLHCEQGLGDTLQFARYARCVAALGARVILQVQAPLVALLSGLEGVAQLLVEEAPLPDFDLHCPLLSLPLAFKSRLDSIPRAPSYLRSDAAKAAHWAGRLAGKTRPLIGLAWRGSSTHRRDRRRSIGLAELLQALPRQLQYVSLHQEIRAEDRAALQASAHLLHYGEQLTDFADTAALCAQVDLVISVDTSVAHLGGALGKTTWVLLPYNPDWRWLLGRQDSPWYPSVRLYRQEAPGDWGPVLARVSAELTQLAR